MQNKKIKPSIFISSLTATFIGLYKILSCGSQSTMIGLLIVCLIAITVTPFIRSHNEYLLTISILGFITWLVIAITGHGDYFLLLAAPSALVLTAELREAWQERHQ